jgi:hypothetical protein
MRNFKMCNYILLFTKHKIKEDETVVACSKREGDGKWARD